MIENTFPCGSERVFMSRQMEKILLTLNCSSFKELLWQGAAPITENSSCVLFTKRPKAMFVSRETVATLFFLPVFIMKKLLALHVPFTSAVIRIQSFYKHCVCNKTVIQSNQAKNAIGITCNSIKIFTIYLSLWIIASSKWINCRIYCVDMNSTYGHNTKKMILFLNRTQT